MMRLAIVGGFVGGFVGAVIVSLLLSGCGGSASGTGIVGSGSVGVPRETDAASEEAVITAPVFSEHAIQCMTPWGASYVYALDPAYEAGCTVELDDAGHVIEGTTAHPEQ